MTQVAPPELLPPELLLLELLLLLLDDPEPPVEEPEPPVEEPEPEPPVEEPEPEPPVEEPEPPPPPPLPPQCTNPTVHIKPNETPTRTRRANPFCIALLLAALLVCGTGALYDVWFASIRQRAVQIRQTDTSGGDRQSDRVCACGEA